MNIARIRPTASVILPVYNAGKFIDEAIESVLMQDFQDFELLLLDDGSTDGSLARLQYFARQDRRCMVHSWQNRGLIATLNAGIDLAKSEILIRMDQDDICRQNRFTKQLEYMAGHPDCVALGSRVLLIDPDGLPITEFVSDFDHDSIDAANLRGCGSAITHPAAVMRKEAVLGVGGYRCDYKHAEDVDLFLRLADVGRLANLSEVLLEYRQHPSSIGYRHSVVQMESSRRAVEDTFNRRNLGLPPTRDFGSDQTVSLSEIYRKWGWWALKAGNSRTARKYARKALSLAPFSRDNLKLCACVLRGY